MLEITSELFILTRVVGSAGVYPSSHRRNTLDRLPVYYQADTQTKTFTSGDKLASPMGIPD